MSSKLTEMNTQARVQHTFANATELMNAMNGVITEGQQVAQEYEREKTRAELTQDIMEDNLLDDDELDAELEAEVDRVTCILFKITILDYSRGELRKAWSSSASSNRNKHRTCTEP